MTREEKIEILNECVIHCGDCKFFKMPHTDGNEYSTCKRLNGDLYRKPDIYQPSAGHYYNRIICREFEPAEWNNGLKKIWTCFDDYKVDYYNTRGLTIGKKSDDEKWYLISFEDFIEGNMDNLKPYYSKKINGYKKWMEENFK